MPGLALAAGAALAAPPASADPSCVVDPAYPRDPCRLNVNLTAAPTCTTLTVHAVSAYPPGSTVPLTLNPGGVLLKTVTADGTGGFTANAIIPTGTADGPHTVVSTGTDSTTGQPLVLSAAVTVSGTGCTPAQPPTEVLAQTVTSGTSTLPFTGFDATLLVATGLLAVTAGLLAVRMGRQRPVAEPVENSSARGRTHQ